jgi:AraC-like DNA-binding protein
MSLEPAQTVERPVLGRVGAGASGPGRDLPSYTRSSGWRDNSVPPAILVELVASAQQALAGDGEEMRRFIARAADLLNPEDEGQEACAHAETAAPAKLHLAPWQTRRVIKFVEDNVAGTIRIEDLAEITRISARQFSRTFRSDFGESPYAYVVRLRIARAKEMMLVHPRAPCQHRGQVRIFRSASLDPAFPSYCGRESRELAPWPAPAKSQPRGNRRSAFIGTAGLSEEYGGLTD